MPSLFDPIRINSMELPHRIIMGPMEKSMANRDGSLSQRYITYLTARAAGGAGLIQLESTYVDTIGMGHLFQVGCHHDHVIERLRQAADAVHAHGSKLALELYLGGRETPSFMSQRQPIGPSVVPCAVLDPMPIPREMTYRDIDHAVEQFRAAGQRAKSAGVDMAHIHGAHGYLICSFLSPFSNRRTDEFGGSLENRARFPLMVVAAMRDQLGSDFPIGYRLSADEFIPEGLTIDETRVFAGMLAEASVDLVDISAGMYESAQKIIQGGEAPNGQFVHYAKAIKNEVGDRTLVSVTQRLSRPEVAQGALDAGIDMVSMSRAFHADPEYINKTRSGKSKDIIPCIGCHHCTNMLEENLVADCSVNPLTTREHLTDHIGTLTGPKRTVLVIGGGPAGMQAAFRLRAHGHEVILVEQGDQLGGQMLYAATITGDFQRFIDFSVSKLHELGVNIRLNTKADLVFIDEMAPDIIVAATGATGAPLFFELDGGIRPLSVFEAFDMQPEQRTGTVVITGGQAVSCFLGIYLAKLGLEVVVVEPSNEIALDKLPASREHLKRLVEEEPGLRVKLETTVERAGVGWVEFQCLGKFTRLEGVGPVVIGGRQACNSLSEELIARGKYPVVVIGDAVSPRTVHDATFEAFKASVAINAGSPLLAAL